MHQQRLPRLQPAALEDVGPDREERLRDRRRLDQRTSVGHRQALHGGHGAVLGIAAAGERARTRHRLRASVRPRPRPARPIATTWPAISRPGRSDAPGGGGYAPRRCSTSGRFTPAAATLTSTSPGPAPADRARPGAAPPGGPACRFRRLACPPLLSSAPTAAAATTAARRTPATAPRRSVAGPALDVGLTRSLPRL